jgi:hypothetical protein
MKNKGALLLLGLAKKKPEEETEEETSEETSEDSDSEDLGSRLGSRLIKAIESGDGSKVYEAFKMLMSECSEDSDD